MRHLLSNIGLAVLCISLSLYAAAASAGMQQTAMVICADGGTETIYMDASGAPMEPGQTCCLCLDCNAPPLLALLPAPETMAPPLPRPALLRLLAVADPFVPSIARPMPRGPPLAQAVGNRMTRRMVVPATFEKSKVSLGDYSHSGGAYLQGSLT